MKKLKLFGFILMALIAIVLAILYAIEGKPINKEHPTFEFIDIVIIMPLVAITLAILMFFEYMKNKPLK